MSTRSVKNKFAISAEGITSSASPASSGVAQLIESKMMEVLQSITERIKLSEERVMVRLGEISAEITNLRADFKSLTCRVNTLDERYNSLASELSQLKTTVNMLDNVAVSSDVVVFNVPNEFEAEVVVDKLFKALPCGSLPISAIFRTRSTNNTTCSPIIVKLNSAHDRGKLFRALAEFRKGKKRQIQLCDMGLNGESTIAVHECLSAANKIILRSALNLKRNKQLNSVFTLRGQVFVRAGEDSKAAKIMDISTLNKVASVNCNTASK